MSRAESVDSGSDGSISDFDEDDDASSVSSVSSIRSNRRSSQTSYTHEKYSIPWLFVKCTTNHLTTTEDKWFFLAKVVLVTMLPVSVLVVVVVRNVMTSATQMDDVEFTLGKMVDQVNLQSLIAMLQKERALISSRHVDPSFGNQSEFMQSYINTDESLDSLGFNVNWQPFWFGYIRMESFGMFKYYLWLNRIHPGENSAVSLPSTIQFYANSISHFISEATKRSLELKNSRVGRALSVGIVITRAKEALGNIHAIGCPFFFEGTIEKEQRYSLLKLRSFKDDIIIMTRYQSITFNAMYENMYINNETMYVEELLDAATNEDAVDYGPEALYDWYTNITEYVGILTRIRVLKFEETGHELEVDLFTSTGGVIALAVLVALMVLCIPVISLIAFQLVTDMQLFSADIVTSLRTIKDEKRRTEDVLLKMLPPTVAKQLKHKKAVMPEVFDSVSIFFSDVVGFTSISAKSTPMQVVAFLNQLYDFFDGVIDRYDVYKVETIGDAYMVTSGLPNKNGERHAHEIAAMSIDLRDGIEHMQIPHMVMHQLQLRIGLHSGPCVAGVVGNKMPRYCLFGQTVQVASKMESTGVAQKIQITKAMNQRLEKLGGHVYVTEPRDKIEIEGVGEVERFWLVGRRVVAKKKKKEEEKIEHKTTKELKKQASVDQGTPKKTMTRQDSSLFRKLKIATVKLLNQGRVGDIEEESKKNDNPS